MKIMVAYDGTLQAKEALVYGLYKAREKGGEVVALQVFNSPMFVDYDATIDAKSLAQAEAARYVEEAKTIMREKGMGVKTSIYSTEGNPSEEIINFAKSENVDILLCPPKFTKIINKYKRALAETELVLEPSKLHFASFSTKTL